MQLDLGSMLKAPAAAACMQPPLSFPLTEISPAPGQKIQAPLLTPTQPLASHPRARWQSSSGRSRARLLSLPRHPWSCRKRRRDQQSSSSGCRLRAALLSPAVVGTPMAPGCHQPPSGDGCNSPSPSSPPFVHLCLPDTAGASLSIWGQLGLAPGGQSGGFDQNTGEN